MNVEYGVKHKLENNTWVFLPLYLTTDLAQHKLQFERAKKLFGKDNVMPVMREVAPWCEMNMKPIDYNWNGAVTKVPGC